ncbi:Integral membrane protein EMC3/TMCO1-like [Trypanosoma melophagium]|uniref:Integral membrane protein EMC3/TMCO1-like n=1 Tax=Trypanosoma melophagium TaxID=715481 RepID=UPI00351A95F3|nr:Integral membrane protein EMC3/TMCO1-like [Trypanosoma melophagium]
MTQNILLDPEIRDWVLLPLIAIVIFVGVLRHYAGLLMSSSPQPKVERICCVNTTNYARLLTVEGKKLPAEAFRQRTEALRQGPLQKKVEINPMEMMQDPSVMGEMMKNNILMMVPNMGMMMLVSYFFSGFVVAKFPFGLAPRFRGMMQRGVDIDDLDCNYVTSLSMYFLIMFGSNGILQLLLGSDVGSSDQAMMMSQMTGGGPQQPVDYAKVFKSLSEELEFEQNRHKWSYENAPKLLLQGN